MLHNICTANVAVRSKREYLLGSTSTQFFASALRRHQCALYFCSSWPSSTMHDMSSTTTLHLPTTELHIEAHCTARLTPSIRAAWDHHSTTFTSALGCANFFSPGGRPPLQPPKAGNSTGLAVAGGSIPGLAAGGSRALPQRLHRDILESFRQLAIRGRRLTACHEALPVQLHASATPFTPIESGILAALQEMQFNAMQDKFLEEQSRGYTRQRQRCDFHLSRAAGPPEP